MIATAAFRRRAGRAARLSLLCLPLLWSGAAAAVLDLSPYASAQHEYDSNVFNLSGRSQAQAQNQDPQLADSRRRSMAGVQASYILSLQMLYGAVEARRLAYDHFDHLDHDERTFGGGLRWQLFGEIDGVVDLRDERRMASFADRRTSQLTLERERSVSNTFNLMLSPSWRLETGLRRHRLASPLPGFPDFQLDESTRSLGIKYKPESRLVSGLVTEFQDSRFSGVPSAPKYSLATVQLVASYSYSDLSSFDAQLGYTRFRDQAGGTADGAHFTGALGLRRRLSDATELNSRLFRRVGSYTVGANAVTDTGASVGMIWQATPMIGLDAGYTWTHSTYQALAGQGAVPSDRVDDYQGGALNLNYQALHWLALRAYGEYRERGSNIDLDRFHGSVAGLELRAIWQ